MADTDRGGGSPGRGGRATYEKRDVAFRRVVIAFTLLLTGTALSLVAAFGVFRYLEGRETRIQQQPSSLTRGAVPPEPPEPRLQTTPVLDLARLRDREREALTSYGWVDRKAGVVRLPIERAIDLLVERGIPPAPAKPTAPATPTALATPIAPAEAADAGKAPAR